MTWWMIYLWTRVGVILPLLVIGAVLIFFFGAGVLIDIFENGHEEHKPLFKKCVSVFASLIVLAVIIPSKGDIAMMYVVPKLASSETINSITTDTQAIVVDGLKALREQLQSLTSSDKVKKGE